MALTPGQKRKSKRVTSTPALWAKETAIVSLVLTLQPLESSTLYPQYTIGLHAWLLDQVRQDDPTLSAYLHDGEAEKPFTLSGLVGTFAQQGRSLAVQANQTYAWTVSALSQRVAQWLLHWLTRLPPILELRGAPLQILQWEIDQPATTYRQLWQTPRPEALTIVLSFASPTSFRRKGHHFPLPVPTNVFHSYLRRWNDFAAQPFDQEDFLAWVEESVLVLRHQLRSVKTVAGKRGSVTGFTGSVEFGLAAATRQHSEFVQLFMALGQLAPYCGTGHKTTFGLGQTRLGWTEPAVTAAMPSPQELLAPRVAALTNLFIAQRQRSGGDRARKTAETWATILARRELGESLQTIAHDLEMEYETVKTYVKLARRSLKPEA